MTDILFDAAIGVLRRIGALETFPAASGSTTTCVVPEGYRNEQDDFWNGGSLFVIQAGSAAPEDEVAVITDFDLGTRTFTFAALTAVIAANDYIGIVERTFGRQVLYPAINDILAQVKVPAWDVSLTSADKQTEYTIPATVPRGSILEVWLQTVDDDSNDNQPAIVHGWTIREGATGATDSLIFHNQPLSGYTIYIKYYTRHPMIWLASDKLNELINLDGLIVRAAERVLQGILLRDNGSKKMGGILINLRADMRTIPLVNMEPGQMQIHYNVVVE
jgi:hypothetical protein